MIHYWVEIDANKRAADYFIDKGYLAAWNYLDYPTY